MKKELWFCLVVLAVVALCGTAYSQADQPGTQTPAKPTQASPAPLQNLSLAVQLRQYGEAQNDPLALLLGARLVRATPMVESTRIAKKPGAAAPTKENAAMPEKPSELDANVLIAEAKRLAAGDADMLAMVAREERAGATRSDKGKQALAALTADYHVDAINARSTDTYEEAFAGGPCAVVVAGDGDTDLDLFIYDRQGNLVCSDTRVGDDCLCQWNAVGTSIYRIDVKNLGSVYNRYMIWVSK